MITWIPLKNLKNEFYQELYWKGSALLLTDVFGSFRSETVDSSDTVAILLDIVEMQC